MLLFMFYRKDVHQYKGPIRKLKERKLKANKTQDRSRKNSPKINPKSI